MNKKILKRKKDFILQPIKNYVTKENHKRVNQYAKYYDKLEIKNRTILYESRDGNSMTDSPYAMFKYMLGNPAFKDFMHIWSIADFDALSFVISKYKDHPNVLFVKRNSKKYLQYLTTCEYLINNSTFQSFFTPKKEQIYINTWHGTPLKTMGFDIPGNPSHSQNVLRNLLSTTYLISPNHHTTNMFTDSYKLKGLYDGTIIEEGYPRIDLTLTTDVKMLTHELRKLGLKMDGAKTILYAPTWKGTKVSKAKNDLLQIIADVTYLEQKIGNDYSILVKVHPFLYKEAIKYPEIRCKLVPDFIDSNELLAIVDMLITDYSSIFFDFLVTGKPILFYTWDADEYTGERGQYLRNDVLPGPILYNSIELAETIIKINSVIPQFAENYKKMQQEFTNFEDGKVTERIVQFIFNHSEKELNLIKGLADEKQKILIYPGGLKDNGITSSFINLMNNIDHNRYDVSCFMATPNDKEVLKNIEKVNKQVRFLFKPGLSAYRILEVYKDKYIHNRGERGFLGKKLYPEKAYKREHARLFGRSQFDFVIDFSGYSLYWTKFLLAANAKKKICYMHNDLLSDSERTINGKKPHRVNLRGLFSVYHRFDKLVSVSIGTMELNRQNLLEYADSNKFDYVMNSIDPSKILQSNVNEAIEENHGEQVVTEKIKARAKLKERTKYPVWNFTSGHTNASLVHFKPDANQTEIMVKRKRVEGQSVYYKFSYRNQIIGWINEDVIELLPDEIISEKEVDKLARLVNPDGNSIWSKPYSVEGIYKVSGSHGYKNIVFKVDKEAETLHGLYNRISHNNKVIGWIDQKALKTLDSFIIGENISMKARITSNLKRKWILSRDYQKHRNIVDNIEDRTLKEVNVDKEMYARIAQPRDQMIRTKAYPNLGAMVVSDAQIYEGQTVKIILIHETRAGTYYQFSIDNKKIGWLESNAFEFIEAPLAANKAFVDEMSSKEEGSLPEEPSQENVNFVNMGRLSPEKGQDNLIRAFANYHKMHNNSRLYILGQGPLKEKLQSLINDLDLEQVVTLMGQVENPFNFMKKCDCFILSSHYEGQPMVLLEAMTLGMNIIATDIVANRTVLEDGKYGLLVENSVSGLEQGMKSMYKKENPSQLIPFDYLQYNSLAMESFYKVLS
ncbi:MAG: CDP-glycerol glycerophosphotransferase family protein [Bacillota bacterium]